jgi:arsenite methyltransferase
MTNSSSFNALDLEEAVRERYAGGAREREEELCCPVEYNPEYLKILPNEIIEKDYGCGDPSRYARPGDTVLDLGSGSGKICYITSQIVGREGKAIGVDMNEEMLHLARKYQEPIAQQIGFDNVAFHRAKIQDLKLNIDALDEYLKKNPVHSMGDLDRLREFELDQRANHPLIPDETVTLVVSNCVLNLVSNQDRKQLFGEIFRVLKRGGRAVISDIVCDEDVPAELQADPNLWSGCISGAFREDEFLRAFETAGFYGVQILKRAEKPWQVIYGIEFRSITVAAYKGKQGPCLEREQAVIYRGPWKAVIDDDGHTLQRGERMAVCDKTFRLYNDEHGPYAADIIPIEPYGEIPLEQAGQFACNKNARRHPRETKGLGYDVTQMSDGPACGPDGCC